LASTFKLNAQGARRELAGKRLSVAIPASVISDTPHLREKTSKIGLIGRAAAVFGVDEILVYRDNPKANQNAELDLIATLLAYMESPQYLRKRLFKLEPRLQYAGILPPLRTPHHPSERKAANLKVGEYREGLVLSQAKEGVLVDIGVENPALLREQVAVNKRLTVQVVKTGEQVEVQTVNRDGISDYWGYRVTVERRSLRNIVENGRFDLTLGTSRKGAGFVEVADGLAAKWHQANSILVVFGSPTRGLYEIAKDEGVRLEDLVDFVVNTIPRQGTETVRTEEALLASLAVLNVRFGF
jgi:predicted SPOUT superfamily RNA methylase MTH1